MKIGLFQYSPVWEDKEKNKNKILSIIEKNNENYDLIIFPEMTLTGFSMNSKDIAECENGESHNFFSNLAKKYNTNIIAGIVENIDNKYYNTLVNIDSNGSLVDKYQKIHLFTLAEEDKYYNEGINRVITKINGCKVGLSICYDLRFPELYRTYGKEKVNLIIVIASWPIQRIEHWRALIKARAIENLSYVIAVNRVGDDIFQKYNGNSMLINPMGDELIRIENEEGLFPITFDENFTDEIRSKLNFLEDIKLI